MTVLVQLEAQDWASLRDSDVSYIDAELYAGELSATLSSPEKTTGNLVFTQLA